MDPLWGSDMAVPMFALPELPKNVAASAVYALLAVLFALLRVDAD